MGWNHEVSALFCQATGGCERVIVATGHSIAQTEHDELIRLTSGAEASETQPQAVVLHQFAATTRELSRR